MFVRKEHGNCKVLTFPKSHTTPLSTCEQQSSCNAKENCIGSSDRLSLPYDIRISECATVRRKGHCTALHIPIVVLFYNGRFILDRSVHSRHDSSLFVVEPSLQSYLMIS
ncbi:hypothetical protein QQG55_47805 [Brugia pahangi]|uniref:Glutaredoxin domain-containing protein n=1 Tax=Brugia pahangi TaxID=6280 RepID=A0A0N4SX29_BRUPA|nr:unnamed protein product [Brugia pahangi]